MPDTPATVVADEYEPEPEDAPMLLKAVRYFIQHAPDELMEEGLQAWDGLASALTRATATTLAERFCADPDAMAHAEPYNAVQTYGVDDAAELQFPDGSWASQLEGSGWVMGQLREDVKQADGGAPPAMG